MANAFTKVWSTAARWGTGAAMGVAILATVPIRASAQTAPPPPDQAALAQAAALEGYLSSLSVVSLAAAARAQQAAGSAAATAPQTPPPSVDDGTQYFQDSDSTRLPSGQSPEEHAFFNSDSTSAPSENPFANSDSTNPNAGQPSAPAPAEAPSALAPTPPPSAEASASAAPEAPSEAVPAPSEAAPSEAPPLSSDLDDAPLASFAPRARSVPITTPVPTERAPMAVEAKGPARPSSGVSVYAEYEDIGNVFGWMIGHAFLWMGALVLATGAVFTGALAFRARARRLRAEHRV